MPYPFPLNLQKISTPKRLELGAEILRKGLPPPTCHVSNVTCHVSGDTCHVLHFTCQFFFLDKALKLDGGGCVVNGATPSSLVI